MNQIIISDEFSTLKEEFSKKCKRILKESESKNPTTPENYENDIIQAYNDIVLHIYYRYETLSEETRKFCISEFTKFREIFFRCFATLGSKIILQECLLQKIDENVLMSEIDCESDTHSDDLGEEHDQTIRENGSELNNFNQLTENTVQSLHLYYLLTKH